MQTPCLLIQPEIVRANIAQMALKAKRSNVLLRPHFKTHQSAEVAQWFRHEGIEAIAVSSLPMAEYFASHGWNDITVALPVNRLDFITIEALARRINLNIVVEDTETIALLESQLTTPVGVYIKIDTGYRRTGIDAEDFDALMPVMNALQETRQLIFIGLLTHAGHTYKATSPAAILEIKEQSYRQLMAIKTFLYHKFPLMQLSYGDTPSCALMEGFAGMDEVRPGNFVFFDLTQVHLGVCTPEQIAIALVAPVLALHPQRSEAVVHAGKIHLSGDSLPLPCGMLHYGMVIPLTPTGWDVHTILGHVTQVSQELGVVALTPRGKELVQTGTLVAILPVHSCLMAHLAKAYVCADGSFISKMNA